ncbi:alpha-amylase [Paucibacter sp. DJ1R-11]|uniref:alpha-amylase family glycosyl hydrolase n=1 Tax=Paucibacter sp. DJ1R-11 TaxID=2893556 RepID=UPI0021E4DEEE|nr:alpha-amylase family glycosyl hydrolase [Paucibacter sp. DJ1R-11]MCV2365210.1 alpha-amylase [Paucibacter sp. DJ1R-11]
MESRRTLSRRAALQAALPLLTGFTGLTAFTAQAQTSLGHIAMSVSSPATTLSASQVHLPWTQQASIYEVNVRQHTPEGTLKALALDLPRLKQMGVDILWLMPLQPIGKKERKGGLGSYYSIRDYTAVNPEFGTLDDARMLVKQAHALGLKVILDWVANHTAWDHPWASAHKDWYKLDARGELFPVTFTEGPEPEYWTDVIALNYDKPELRRAMIAAMKFWVREIGLDGFRCDVASLVPTDFWERARAELDALKPMFMLAESDKVDLHAKAFDMTYGWDLAHLMRDIAQGKADAEALRAWVRQQAGPQAPYPAHAYRMRFTNNHDFNSWHGTDRELYGPAFEAMAVLSFTLPGMPLVYSGQEAALDKRLAFFEKDPIDWKTRELQGFYSELLALKKRLPALANGQYGASVELLDVANPQVFAFRRQTQGQGVTVLANLTPAAQRYRWQGQELELAAWQSRLLSP